MVLGRTAGIGVLREDRQLNALSLVSGCFQPYDSNELSAVLNHSRAEPDTC